MTGMRTTPCNWPMLHCGEVGGICTSLSGLDPTTAAGIVEAAKAYLWNWTRRQFGTCTVGPIRPCREQCLEMWSTYRGRGGPSTNLPWYEGWGPLNPALIGGQWYNLGCGGSCNSDPCSCNYVPTVELAGPVASIESVWLNGALLDPSAYRVDNYRFLVRTDGGDWPVCQNMLLDPHADDDTFEVNYNIGTEVPAGGQLAAGILACEMAKAACGNDRCQLPQRMQMVTRQGVQSLVLDSYNTLYQFGTTGIWLVDNWVASIMASNRQSGMRVASPDVRPPRRTTG